MSAATTSAVSPSDALADALFEAEAQAARESPARRPGATYRLQLHHGFRFDDVSAIVDYLADLGVTDVYLSPFLAARPGSTHGYDVFDHGRLNPEIGDESAYERMVARLAEHGLGRLLDVVPNHMGVGDRNPYWVEVLEIGPQAPAARFFDIDWRPVKEELGGRVLLPILEAQYGEVLEDGLFSVERDGGALFVRYRGLRLPLAPRSYATVLSQRIVTLLHSFDPEDEHVVEYRSISDSARSLAPRDAADPGEVERNRREKEVIKRRLARLCDESPALREFLDGNIALLGGIPGDPRSFDPMHGLLEEQVYRLAYWRVAAQEINYRRFFDINDLAGLRTEDPKVFDSIHELIFRWVDAGGVTGLRVDHPDGLADPAGYFRRLQETAFLRVCRRRLDADDRGREWSRVAEPIRARYREAVEGDPRSPLARYLPVVAEKILSRGEELPPSWPIDGTVGYEYLNALNGLFVAPSSAEAIEQSFAEFTGDRSSFADVLYESKRWICAVSLASEVNMLARQLDRLCQADRRHRDFTLTDLRRALIEVISCFPVYRTYLTPGVPPTDQERGFVEQAVARARRRNPAVDASVFAFVQQVLLEVAEDANPEARALRDAFVRRFQQTTGPVQAKGLEDTAFYRQVKLASLNEVGGDPSRYGTAPSAFHALNAQRLERWPGGLSATATHDTKRGEDTRIRIDALTELADEWRTRLARWSRINGRRKAEFDGKAAPDAREEYLLYQTLVGAWPFGGPDDAPPEGLVARIQQYMNKAVKEAKLNTSWTDPDPTYGDLVARFVAETLTGPDSGPFLRDFLPFQRRVARIGVVHSLAQTLLKLASPGVPDLYQGCELWDLSLVDPDNRHPVDYGHRRRLLASILDRLAAGTPRRDLCRGLIEAPADGAVKLYLIRTVLHDRRRHRDLYREGGYRPIEAEGSGRGQLVAFARSRGGRTVLAVAPRLVARLMGDDANDWPIGEPWGDTRLILPVWMRERRWLDLLTDTEVAVRPEGGRSTLPLAEVFATLPVALLVNEPE